MEPRPQKKGEQYKSRVVYTLTLGLIVWVLYQPCSRNFSRLLVALPLPCSRDATVTSNYVRVTGHLENFNHHDRASDYQIYSTRA